ncbi:MAG: signal recognition particle receptor subunit alpha [Candidatus Aenigmarchaeota archaeon]|nr:signal recognition particle receptor subunit alpha [Candidatus Aenigmarchaeota archaeon]MBU5689218.1 signal recognition particle receptor subunit alpha [Candidatus Aenigmarchaeota archaeon]
MLDFGKKITELVSNILGRSTIDKDAIEELIKGLQRILLQADVDVKLVYELSNNIRNRCFKEKIPTGFTLREHVTKVVYEELVGLLGKEKSDISDKRRIMLLGLYGVGKTTTAGKLARYFQKKGKRPALIACDYHRPAATEQLKQIANQLNVPIHIDDERNPYNAVKEGIKRFEKSDVIIIDTAGRDTLDKELSQELKKLGEIAKPDEVLLVIPADLGRVAGQQAAEFNKLVGITGVIVTKMDGTARGGAALSSCYATGAKVKFLGVGEKLDQLEQYDPVRFVSRMLGMGDLQTLMEKIKESELKEEDAKRIISGKFTLKDFYDQIAGMQKMGPLSGIMEMIPGLSTTLPEEIVHMQEEKLKKYKYIIDSMTKEERENPEIIHASRVKRIAKGAGVQEKDVRDLLKQYELTKKVIKKVGGTASLKRGQLAKLAKKFGLKF